MQKRPTSVQSRVCVDVLTCVVRHCLREDADSGATLFRVARDWASAVAVVASEDEQGRLALNRKQVDAFLSATLLRRSLFLTGGAGVGKTHVCHRILARLRECNPEGSVLVCASTGAAARLIDGTTIHRAFNIRTRFLDPAECGTGKRVSYVVESTGKYSVSSVDPDDSYESEGDEFEAEAGERKRHLIAPFCCMTPQLLLLLASLRCLVVDEARAPLANPSRTPREPRDARSLAASQPRTLHSAPKQVSMVSAELMDVIDHALRFAKKVGAPFGGTQVLFVGDMLQLPPVMRFEDFRRTKETFAFESRAWRELAPRQIALDVQMRQDADQAGFVAVLNRARLGALTDADVSFLEAKSRKDGKEADDFLCFTKKLAAHRNNARMEELEGKEVRVHALDAMLAGNRHPLDVTEWPRNARPNSSAAAEVLLKVGAKVRCTRNVYGAGGDLRFVNGELGTVLGCVDEEAALTSVGKKYGMQGTLRSVVMRSERTGEEAVVPPIAYRRRQAGKKKAGKHEAGRNGAGKKEAREEEVERKEAGEEGAGRVTHVRVQVPLALAFGRHFHSSQGESISRPVDMNLSAVWYKDDETDRWTTSPGVVYVALSRASRLDQIRFVAQMASLAPARTFLDRRACRADETALDFYRRLEKEYVLPFWTHHLSNLRSP